MRADRHWQERPFPRQRQSDSVKSEPGNGPAEALPRRELRSPRQLGFGIEPAPSVAVAQPDVAAFHFQLHTAVSAR
jgi:hypothetical protein